MWRLPTAATDTIMAHSGDTSRWRMIIYRGMVIIYKIFILIVYIFDKQDLVTS